jgi:hypothetical protein
LAEEEKFDKKGMPDGTQRAAKESEFDSRNALASTWPRFFTMVKMLLRNTLNLDFKSDFKRSLIKTILGCARLCRRHHGISYFFFSIVLAIPDLLDSLFRPRKRAFSDHNDGLFPRLYSCLVILAQDCLYWNNDNKIMITFPCNANTVFVARMFVFFVSQFLKTLLIEIPFLFGYMIFSRVSLGITCFGWWCRLVLARPL